MKGILTATALVALMTAPAVAADLKGGKAERSIALPEPVAQSEGVMEWSGIWLTGKLGVASREYDLSHSASGQGGEYTKAGEVITYDPAGRPIYFGGIGGSTSLDEDESFDGDLEVSYVQRIGRFMIEPFFAASMPFGADPVGVAYEQKFGVFDENGDRQKVGGSGNCSVGQDDATCGTLEGVGYLSAEKRFDLTPGLKIGALLDSRLYGFVGAGPSWGFFKVKGGHAADLKGVAGGAYPSVDANYSDSESALGYALFAGVKYAMTSRIMVGVEGSYKDWGSLETTGGSHDLKAASGTAGAYTSTSGRGEVDVNEWAIKGTVSIKLNGIND